MPIKSGRGNRKRETLMPVSFINDRRRGKTNTRQQMTHLVEEPSVVMSRAENTSASDKSTGAGARRSSRRVTRLTDVDMVLDETDCSMQSRESRSMALDKTNTSIVNVDQTIIERERLKSMALQRWTKSNSLATNEDNVEQNRDNIRRSSIYSMITKRNRRRARSGVKNIAQEEPVIRNPSTGERNTILGRPTGMDLSQISEEQQNTADADIVSNTPEPLVRESIIQTRSMMKRGKKLLPSTCQPSSASKASKARNNNKKATTQNVRTGRRNQQPPATDIVEETSAQKEKTNPGFSTITRRKRKASNLKKNLFEDSNQNVSFKTKDTSQAERPHLETPNPAKTDEVIAIPKSNSGNISQSSKESKRNRRHSIPDKDQTKEKTPPVDTSSNPEPPKEITNTQSVTQQCRKRCRSRKQTTSVPAGSAPVEPTKVVSPENGYAPRSEIDNPIQRRRAKSRTRDANKPSTPELCRTSRAKSVPRNVLLSPPSVNANHTSERIPIYRRYAEKILQLDRTGPDKPDSSNIPSTGDDVYTFDSSSQSSTTTTAPCSERVKKTKKSTAKKLRPRLATSASSRERKTPTKHISTVFGTDMGRINRLVKKIGGGPVRRTAQDEASSSTVHTSTLAAMVNQQPSNAENNAPRSPSPAISIHDDHHQDLEDEENIPSVEMPTPLSPPRLNPLLQRVLQQQQAHPVVNTPDKGHAHPSPLNFSPQASSSPWRIQNENVLPKTFYFSRSNDLLPSYESDLVVRDDNRQAASSPRDILPAPVDPVQPRRTSLKQASPFVQPTAVPPAPVSASVFKDIQKSYQQLKATSEMSEKLISAMKQYKTNVHNRTAASIGDDSTAEELIAEFRKYEENMKKTYLKLEQWYKRSQRNLNNSMKVIEQTSALPKTPAQEAVVENFRRDSHRFATMLNDIQSAMNDSNIENISPPKSTKDSGRPPFKDVILTDRNRNDRNRSPLRALDITNVPPRFSPIKSPLVKPSIASFTGNRTILHSRSRDRFSKLSLVKPSNVSNETAIGSNATLPTEAQKSVIEIADTVVENETVNQRPEKDLFGFESEDEPDEAEKGVANPTSPKITRETLKERLQSVRKLLPAPCRTGPASEKSSTVGHRSQRNAPRIFNSPHRKRLPSIQNAFSASTPLTKKRSEPARQEAEHDPNLSAIRASCDRTMEPEKNKERETARKQESPPAAVFDEPEDEFGSLSIANVNRTYSRIPRRNLRRKPNIYLRNLGISDDETDDDPEPESSDSDDWPEPGHGKRRKKTAKDRAKTQKRKKKTNEQTAEFRNFVNDFNSMVDQVNQYQLVIEKPSIPQPG